MLGLLLAGIVIVPWPQKITETGGVCPADAPVEILRDETFKPEEYAVCVSTCGVKITASGTGGEFRARETLRQLKSDDGAFYACCEIRDYPRFPWRGLLLDEARHFFGKEYAMSVIDRMVEHKLNVLHWHLVDDQGWRIEIKGHPELVQYGAVRPRSVKFGNDPQYSEPGHEPSFELNDEPYGPYYYTQEDIREILAYAKARHVRVVPEIELPGHVRALLAAHPELSCVGESLARVPRIAYGVERDVLCAGNDAVFRLLEDVFDEVCDLFSDSEVIHIGGDECPMTRWKTCAKCQAKMKKLGFVRERQLHSWMVRHFASYLSAKGRRVIGWAEILDKDIPQSVMGMVWLGGGPSAARAARRGADLVCTPGQFCYVDTEQELAEDPYHYNYDRGIDLKRAYWFDPCEGVALADRHHVVGGQFNCWSETTFGRFDFEWKTWPRGCAIAEVLWTGPEKRDWNAFRDRLEIHRKRLISRKVNCAPFNRWEVEIPTFDEEVGCSEKKRSRLCNAFLGKLDVPSVSSNKQAAIRIVESSDAGAFDGLARQKFMKACDEAGVELFSFEAFVCTGARRTPVFVCVQGDEAVKGLERQMLRHDISVINLGIASEMPNATVVERLRRIADWVFSESAFDGTRMAVCGYGRGGELALASSVLDSRFALTYVADAGSGLAQAYSLVAPRMLLVASTYGQEDSTSEFAALCTASACWERAGGRGLIAPGGFPAQGAPQLDGLIGFHLRPARRKTTTYDWIPPYDWSACVNFAIRHGWGAEKPE